MASTDSGVDLSTTSLANGDKEVVSSTAEHEVEDKLPSESTVVKYTFPSVMRPAEDTSTDAVAPKSKRQLAKLEKFLRKKEYLRQRRGEEREKRKQARKRRREDAAGGEPVLSRKQLKRNAMAQSSNRVRVAIDMSYDELMSDKDVSSCIQQLGYSYAANRRAVAPLQFHIVGFSGRSRTLFDSQPDRRAWDVHLSGDDYATVFDKTDVVYLTSESDNVLQTVEENKVYVIGGLVDHNFHKGVCHRRAIEAGVAHARLPIDEYVALKCRKVLAVNHVLEILLKYTECNDWEQAFFHVIPKRKNVELKPVVAASGADNAVGE